MTTFYTYPELTPIQEDQFPADGESCANLGSTDAAFKLLEELLVAGGELEAFFHEIDDSTKIADDNRHYRCK